MSMNKTDDIMKGGGGDNLFVSLFVFPFPDSSEKYKLQCISNHKSSGQAPTPHLVIPTAKKVERVCPIFLYHSFKLLSQMQSGVCNT